MVVDGIKVAGQWVAAEGGFGAGGQAFRPLLMA